MWPAEEVDGVLELAGEAAGGLEEKFPAGVPLRIEGFDITLVGGKEDKEACLLTPLVVEVVPLVEGR